MKKAESDEHLAIKAKMSENVKEWFQGISLKEYKVAGHEADIYGITSDGVVIHAEVIWSPSCYHQNMTFLLISDANVRIAIFSPKALVKFGEDYEKIRLEQAKKGTLFTEAFSGDMILKNDADYLKLIYERIAKMIEKVPSEFTSTHPRSYWYVNDDMLEKIAPILKEKNWKQYGSTSKIVLLEKKHCITPIRRTDEQFSENTLGPGRHMRELDFQTSKKLVKIYGRFHVPFGVNNESMVQFVWDPCYERRPKTNTSNVHIQPKHIRSSIENGGLLGIDNWQRPSIFLIGKFQHLEPWQPPIIEPLVIYTSENQSKEFHEQLISLNSRIEPPEDAFEDVSDVYGLEKAEKLLEIIQKELNKVLETSCWKLPNDSYLLRDAYDLIAKLLTDKDNSDALSHILYLGDEFSIDFAKEVVTRFLAELSLLKTRYEAILREMISVLNPEHNFDVLYNKWSDYLRTEMKIIENIKKTAISKVHTACGFGEEGILDVQGYLEIDGEKLEYNIQMTPQQLKYFRSLIQ